MPSIKKNLAYNTILSASQVLLPLISIPYISRVLDPEGIGKVSFIDSFTYYFISIAEFGIVVYGMREIARLKDNIAERGKVVSELLALHIISSAAALLIYFVSIFFVWEKIADIRLLLFSLSFLLVNFFACEWYFIGMEQFRYITIRSLITRLLGLASIFVLINSRDDYFIYYASITVAAMANSLWNNFMLFRQVPVSFRKINWRKHVAPSLVTYFISLSYSITLFLDNVLLGLVSTQVAVAFYAFPMKIARTLTVLLTDSLLVFFPRIVALLKEKETAKVQHIILKNLQLLIFFGIPLSAGLYLVAEQLISVFLGNQFLPAVSSLRILAFFPLLRAYNLFLSKQVLITHNQERLYLFSLITGSLLFIFLSLVLSSYFAERGACYAIIATEVFMLGMNYYFARRIAGGLRLFDVKAMWQACMSAALIVPVVYLVINWYSDSSLTVLLVATGLGAMVYFFVQLFVLRNDFSIIIRDKITNFLSR